MPEHANGWNDRMDEMDQSAVRLHALDLAVGLVVNERLVADEIVPLATEFYRWIIGPASLSLAMGPIRLQDTQETTGRNASAMTQLHDNEEFDIELSAADAKGAAVSDDPTSTTDDPSFVTSDPAVFTYAVDPTNPRKATIVAGLPGSAVGTVSLGSITATHAVDVVPAGIATVALAEGTVRTQAPVVPPQV